MKTKKEETDMIAIAQRITASPAANPAEMALRIKREAPTLAALTPAQLEQIARLVMTQRLAAEFNSAVDLAGIDWHRERETFLNDTRSAHTRRAYTASLTRLETWTNREGINPLSMSAAQADQFIRDLKAGELSEKGREVSAATARRDIAAVSAFYSFLERYHAAIKNPVRGTKLRPSKTSKRETVIPTATDMATILAGLPPVEQAIVETLSRRGLRAGALPTLERKAGKYHGISKGKALEENGTEGITIPREALNAIKAAKLDIERPFAGNTAAAIERRINYHIGKLYQAGKIRAAYSCHDFRHFFAVTEYQKDRDIYRVSSLLNHSGLQITQTYLKSLGVTL